MRGGVRGGAVHNKREAEPDGAGTVLPGHSRLLPLDQFGARA